MNRRLRRLIRRAKHRIIVVGEILRHPQTPWYVRLIAILVVAYAASPIDLIPDFIPIVGYLDDLLLLPLGVMLILRLSPRSVVHECTRRALSASSRAPGRRYRHLATVLIVAIWMVVVLLLVRRIVSM